MYDTDAPHISKDVYDMGIPILGICYGLQETAHQLGGTVSACSKREFGHAQLKVVHEDSALFKDIPVEFDVWMFVSFII